MSIKMELVIAEDVQKDNHGRRNPKLKLCQLLRCKIKQQKCPCHCVNEEFKLALNN